MLKTSFADALQRNAMSLISKAVPFLGNGFFGPIVGYWMGVLFAKLMGEAEVEAFIKYIELRTTPQGRAFEASAFKYHNAKQSGDQKEVERARKKFLDDFHKLALLTN
jgi:hypothetical protein